MCLHTSRGFEPPEPYHELASDGEVCPAALSELVSLETVRINPARRTKMLENETQVLFLVFVSYARAFAFLVFFGAAFRVRTGRFFTSKVNSPSFMSTDMVPPSITPRETISPAIGVRIFD